jgi:hypothetical protein
MRALLFAITVSSLVPTVDLKWSLSEINVFEKVYHGKLFDIHMTNTAM